MSIFAPERLLGASSSFLLLTFSTHGFLALVLLEGASVEHSLALNALDDALLILEDLHSDDAMHSTLLLRFHEIYKSLRSIDLLLLLIVLTCTNSGEPVNC